MSSPLSVSFLLIAGFVLGALPAALLALESALASHVRDEEEPADRSLRRFLYLPPVLFLPIGGWFADAWGGQHVALFGLALLTVGMTLLALVPVARTAGTNLAGLAVGLSFFATGVLAWMPLAFRMPDSETPRRAVEALNLGFVAIGLGWLLGGWLSRSSQRLLGVKNTLLLGAGAMVIVFGLLVSLPYESAAADAIGPFTQDLRFWLLLGTLLLYFPIESCVEVWSAPLLRKLTGGDVASVRRRLVAFWLAFLFARFFAFWFLKVGLEPWFLLACALVSAMVIGNLVGAAEASSGTIGFWLLGFCYGPLLPGFLGMMCDHFPGQRGVILGLMLAIGSFYNALLYPLLQRYLHSHTVQQAMRLPMLLMLALCAPLLVVIMFKFPGESASDQKDRQPARPLLKLPSR